MLKLASAFLLRASGHASDLREAVELRTSAAPPAALFHALDAASRGLQWAYGAEAFLLLSTSPGSEAREAVKEACARGQRLALSIIGFVWHFSPMLGAMMGQETLAALGGGYARFSADAIKHEAGALSVELARIASLVGPAGGGQG
jgi:hypothetical protein